MDFWTHPLFVCLEENGGHGGDGGDGLVSVVKLLPQLKEDKERHPDALQFIFFDFDDTLHHTATAAQQLYHSRLSDEDMKRLEGLLVAEGIYFNAHDPPVHPHMLSFLHHLKQEHHNVLLLSAGSAAQTTQTPNGTEIELTLITNYARYWRSEFNESIFDVLGTHPSLLPPAHQCYWSPTAFSVRAQLTPTPKQQKAANELFAHVQQLKEKEQRALGPMDAALLEQSRLVHGRDVCDGEVFDAMAHLATHTTYCSYHGIIPVYGTKRDALLRYFHHLTTHTPSVLQQKVFVYFVDDQPRYLRDVADYPKALLLIALRKEDPLFCDWVGNENAFVVRTYAMPAYRPVLPAH